MSDELENRLAQLRQAYESGALDEDTYHAAVAGLKAASFRAETTSGAVAQGEGATALGKRSVQVGGDVLGDIITGNVYRGPKTEDPTEALQIYCQVLAQSSGYLPLRGMDASASDPAAEQRPMGLANVYIALNTTAAVDENEVAGKDAQRARSVNEREQEPVSALQATAEHRRLVILGDPGSGKSTFIHYLAHCLASHALDPAAQLLQSQLTDWPVQESDIVPVVVILRDFARSLPDPLPKPEPGHLWQFIKAQLTMQNLEFAAPALLQALEDGRTLLLLDGLDEVPTIGQRIFVRQAILAFLERYDKDHAPRNRYVVTSRILAYREPQAKDEPDLRLPEDQFPAFELAKFDERQIDQFIAAWYQELARLGIVNEPRRLNMTRQLQEAVRRPDLKHMATNPLLLTIMALSHAHKGSLPDARALLYEDTVDMMLWRWEQVKLSGEEERTPLRQLLVEANRTDMDLKRVLGQVAYEAHAQVDRGMNGERTADVGELRLLKAVAELNNADMGWAQKLLGVMKLRAGLLVERLPEVFTFPHRTFQEYLAGTHLASRGDFATQALKLFETGEENWRVVLLLSVGHLVYLLRDSAKPLGLVAELCPAKAADETAAWRKAWLAGDVMLEMGVTRVGDSTLGRELLERVQDRLVALLKQGSLTPRERADAGVTLARLGDPRPDVMALDEMHFCLVPAGPFWMGSDEHDEEKPIHQVDLPYFYFIGRFPITQSQYAEFINAGGYKNADYWPEALQEGVWDTAGIKKRENESVRQWPHDYGSPSNLPNHPVVGVTWYEALAFSRWLTNVWHASGLLPAGWQVRLPSEAEWEKAARGGLRIPLEPTIVAADQLSGWMQSKQILKENPQPQRRYPWGNELALDCTNYRDSGIGRTTAIGMFPQGTSPYGCEEMAGNVLEWTRSQQQDYPYRWDDGREQLAQVDNSTMLVSRGGSFVYGSRWLRCSARLWHSPQSLHYGSLGFRLVIASETADSGGSVASA